MDIISTIIVGVISSLVASSVFLFTLFRLKPEIEISPYIAEEKDQKGKYYSFKIINKTKRPIIDIRCDAVIAKPTNVEGGPVYWSHHIPLNKNFMFQIGKFDLNDKNADYALRFTTNEDLDTLWNNDADILRFRIIATDSLSGFSRSYLKEYRTKRNCIKKGSHQWGPGLDVS